MNRFLINIPIYVNVSCVALGTTYRALRKGGTVNCVAFTSSRDLIDQVHISARSFPHRITRTSYLKLFNINAEAYQIVLCLVLETGVTIYLAVSVCISLRLSIEDRITVLRSLLIVSSREDITQMHSIFNSTVQ